MGKFRILLFFTALSATLCGTVCSLSAEAGIEAVITFLKEKIVMLEKKVESLESRQTESKSQHDQLDKKLEDLLQMTVDQKVDTRVRLSRIEADVENISKKINNETYKCLDFRNNFSIEMQQIKKNLGKGSRKIRSSEIEVKLERKWIRSRLEILEVKENLTRILISSHIAARKQADEAILQNATILRQQVGDRLLRFENGEDVMKSNMSNLAILTSNLEKGASDMHTKLLNHTSETARTNAQLFGNHSYFDATFYAEANYDRGYIECHSDSNAEKIRFSRVVDTGRGGGLPSDANFSTSERSARMDLGSVGWSERLGAYRCGFEAEQGSADAVVTLQDDLLYFPDPSVVASVGDNATLRLHSNYPSFLVVWSRDGQVITSWNGRMEVVIVNSNQKETGIYSVRYEDFSNDWAVGRLSVRRCKANVFGERCDRVCPPCYNGGICHDLLGTCVCPEGFVGRNCETPCPEGFHGADCSTACADGDCERRLFCKPDPYGCSCAPGFKGVWCHENCEPRWYGASCKQPCHCAGGGDCNQFTGACPEACASGWKGLSCQIRGDE